MRRPAFLTTVAAALGALALPRVARATPPPPSSHVWTDTEEWYIAADPADLVALLREHGYSAEMRPGVQGQDVVSVWYRDEPGDDVFMRLRPADRVKVGFDSLEEPDFRTERTETCEQWIAENGRGLLASVYW